MPFMLTNAAAAGAGAPVATSGGAAGAAKVSYRLDGTESTLTPHVGHKVEITGTVEERPASAAAGGANAPAGTLKVDSVKMVSTTCP
jgi:hypothetical protein